MKSLPKIIGTLVLMSTCVMTSGTAMAQHRGHGHGHSGGARLGLFLGVPLLAAAAYYPRYYPSYYSSYYPAPYYYPPAAVVSAPPPAYVEQYAPQAALPQQAQGDWYYCAASRNYYPYVSECPSGWQRMPPQPPR